MSLVSNSAELKDILPSENKCNVFVASYQFSLSNDNITERYQRNVIYIPVSIIRRFESYIDKMFFKTNNLYDAAIYNMYDYVDYLYRNFNCDPIIEFVTYFNVDKHIQYTLPEISHTCRDIKDVINDYKLEVSDRKCHVLDFNNENIEYFLDPSWENIKPYLNDFDCIRLEDSLPDLNDYTMCVVNEKDSISIYVDFRIIRQFRDKLIHYGNEGSVWTVMLEKYYERPSGSSIDIYIESDGTLRIFQERSFDDRIQKFLKDDTSKDVVIYKGNISWEDLYGYLDVYGYMNRHKLKSPIFIDNTKNSNQTTKDPVKTKHKGFFSRLFK